MHRKFLLAFVFACIGIAAEIVFTGLKYNVVLPLMQNTAVDFTLDGQSYIWMLFIYGAIPFLLPPIYKALHTFPLLVRLILYALICLSVEFISGYVLQLITGSCPWFYTEGITILGLVRLDYFPIWMIFGYFIEKVWLMLNSKFSTAQSTEN